MMMKYVYLSGFPKIFLTMTGLYLNEFDALMDEVEPFYQAAERKRLNRPDRQRDLGGGDHPDLSGRDQVLLTVIWLRQYPTQDVLGYFFGISQATVSRYLERILPILEQDGRDRMRMPDPGRKRRRTLDELLRNMPEIMVVIDSFEQTVQRPKDAAERDAWYSGKKKTHTIKSQVAVDEETGEIVDIPESVPGPTADITLLDQSELLDNLPEGVGGMGDSGYQGIAKLHKHGFSPRKKPRGKDRPPEDVAYNTAFSRRRIVVENTNNRIRRYQSLAQTDRNHRQNHTRRVRAVAGLVNRQIRHRLSA
jgi:DDE superfamily endonuclease/Helix-turn-helix of DDE superfamily endonuclease